MKRNKIILLSIILVVMVVLTILLVNRLQFSIQDRKIKNYVDSIANITQVSNEKSDNYCDRTKIEFYSGPLYCYLNYDFTTDVLDNSTLVKITDKTKDIKWAQTQSEQMTSDQQSDVKYMERVWYKDGKFDCVVIVTHTGTLYSYSLSCQGPKAILSWYPEKRM